MSGMTSTTESNVVTPRNAQGKIAQWETLNNPDLWPDGIDTGIEEWKCAILNRIDREYGCDVLIWHDEYCAVPEWDPFSNRCAEHSPDNGGWGA